MSAHVVYWYCVLSRVRGGSGKPPTARGQRHSERLPDRGSSTRGHRVPTLTQCPDRGRCRTHVFCAESGSQQYGGHAGVGQGQGYTVVTAT